jgi:hypothetical protein
MGLLKSTALVLALLGLVGPGAQAIEIVDGAAPVHVGMVF